MKIMVNGAEAEIHGGSLADALAELGYADAQVATAVNEAFVPKGSRKLHALKPGDRVEIVAPRQGG